MQTIVINDSTKEKLHNYNWDPDEVTKELPRLYPAAKKIHVQDCTIRYIMCKIDEREVVINCYGEEV